jgi:hypothetical protein
MKVLFFPFFFRLLIISVTVEPGKENHNSSSVVFVEAPTFFLAPTSHYAFYL